MNSIIFNQYEEICAERGISGRVLEIGATADDQSLLCLNALSNVSEKIGLNLEGPHRYRDFIILQGNANSMYMFENNYFDAVLCNAVLEHDKYFWKTIAEIYRVAKSGSVIIIGTPGYNTYSKEKAFKRFVHKTPVLRRLEKNKYFNSLMNSTITYEIHNAPGDYYRFSPQAYREVFFSGCADVNIRSVMVPPRLIGSGIKC